MLSCMDCSKKYKHDYFFEFKDEKYRVHSVVKLTEEARLYLGAMRNEVILTEVYYNHIFNRTLYKYEFKSIKYNVDIINKSTDRTPDEMLEEVIVPASVEYASREIFGIDSPYYKVNAATKTKKDWEIPEVRKGWIILILILIGVSIFKDWYVQLLIRLVACWIFGLYRKSYVDAHTTYTHSEDDEILMQKYHALYGIGNIKKYLTKSDESSENE